MKNIFTIIIILSLISCEQEKKEPERIDFNSGYLLNSAIENKISSDTVSNENFTGFKYQMAASEYAAKGDYKNALKAWDTAFNTSKRNCSKEQIDSINSLYRKINAKNFIIQQAKSSKILIINEAHHSPLHRFFTKSLLKQLYDQGYKNLGLEGLSNGKYLDSLLNQRKYPIQKTGWYIVEPQFGDLVREALEIGYYVFPYEDTTETKKKHGDREIYQATNIKNIVEQKPNEKFLIHCGFDHVMEGKHGSWGKAMAERLKEYTGIDPLTVNQVVYSEKSEPKFNPLLQQAINPKKSVVLLNQQNEPIKYVRGEAWSDITIVHPTTKFVANRTDWIFTNGNERIGFEIPNIEIEFPVLVLAFKKGEDIYRSVPYDIVEISDKNEECLLALKNGNYNIVITNGVDSYKVEMEVK